MSRQLMFMFLAAAMIITSGCSQYVEDYQYAPRPALAEIPSTQPDMGPPLSALASIVGIRREDRDARLPESIEVRLQLNNNGPQQVMFDPNALRLTDGSLFNFPPPIIQASQPLDLAPGQSLMLGVFFPIPAGRDYDDFDLESFQLRWTVQLGGRPVTQVVYFHRVHVYYRPYDYYDYPPGPFFVGGTVIVHHR